MKPRIPIEHYSARRARSGSPLIVIVCGFIIVAALIVAALITN